MRRCAADAGATVGEWMGKGRRIFLELAPDFVGFGETGVSTEPAGGGGGEIAVSGDEGVGDGAVSGTAFVDGAVAVAEFVGEGGRAVGE